MPRPVVNKPPFAIPLSGTISDGSGSDIEAKNSFTKNSMMVTFGVPNITYCSNAKVTKWKVEWDTVPTFDSRGTGAPLSYNETLGTSPEIKDRGDGEGEIGTGFYNITDLVMGVRYYVRVTAFNSLGYGEPADYIDAIPCVSPDAPGLPTLVSQKSRELATSSQELATTLQVTWNAPFASAKFEDENGDGGDAISAYVVEWSRRPFESYNKTVQYISVECPGIGARLTGEIRLMHNTTALNVPASLLLPRVRSGMVIPGVHVHRFMSLGNAVKGDAIVKRFLQFHTRLLGGVLKSRMAALRKLLMSH